MRNIDGSIVPSCNSIQTGTKVMALWGEFKDEYLATATNVYCGNLAKVKFPEKPNKPNYSRWFPVTELKKYFNKRRPKTNYLI